jgi:hypothetical protein
MAESPVLQGDQIQLDGEVCCSKMPGVAAFDVRFGVFRMIGGR